MPSLLLTQARLAARSGSPIDTVLRRYFAGYALLGDFLVEGAEALAGGRALKSLLRTQGIAFDAVLGAVIREYTREAESLASTSEERRTEQIRRLLAGERLDTLDLGYDFEGWHLGAYRHWRRGRECGSHVRQILCRPHARGTEWRPNMGLARDRPSSRGR